MKKTEMIFRASRTDDGRVIVSEYTYTYSPVSGWKGDWKRVEKTKYGQTTHRKTDKYIRNAAKNSHDALEDMKLYAANKAAMARAEVEKYEADYNAASAALANKDYFLKGEPS